jgi:lactate dehydrogenase-like 2-hydroxyacid dehydrogenase
MTLPHKVLILSIPLCEIPFHTPEYKQFSKQFDISIYEPTTEEELIQKLQTEYNDVSAIWTTATSVFRFGGIAKFIPYFSSTVKVYVFPWVGYTEEEARLLHERDIVFCNVGDISAHDVADQALHLTLGTFRFNSFFEHQFRAGLNILDSRTILGSKGWDAHGEPLPPPERANLAESVSVGGKKIESPTGKIAGIVGLGSIGKEIGRRLTAIGMEVLYNKRSPLSESEEAELGYKATFVPTFEEMSKKVDLIVIAVPHSPETTDLISRESLKKMKRGVRIVNIGRGSAIDEDALLEALENGIVNSVGLDVFRGEPFNINPKFAKRWDVTMTPHLGNVSTDNIINGNIRCMKNIKNVLLEGGTGFSQVVYTPPTPK